MEDLRTFYDVLEISETASAAEAATAYKRMVKEYHPDRLVGLPEHLTKLRKDAEEKWQESMAGDSGLLGRAGGSRQARAV